MSDALDRLRVRSAAREVDRDNLDLDDEVEGEALPYKTAGDDYARGWNDGLDGHYTYDGDSGPYWDGYQAAQRWKQERGMELP